MLQQHFQSELKQAFSGDNAGIDMLNRMQELEDELEQVKKNCDGRVKQLEEQHEKEKAEIKEDFAITLQVRRLPPISHPYLSHMKTTIFWSGSV